MKIGLLTFFALSGSLLGLSAVSIAGPKENYADPCTYLYSKNNASNLCVTKKGRVLWENFLHGYLGRDRTVYEPVSGGFITSRYEQINKGLTLVEYICVSNYSGTCTQKATKSLYKYEDPNNPDKTPLPNKSSNNSSLDDRNNANETLNRLDSNSESNRYLRYLQGR